METAEGDSTDLFKDYDVTETAESESPSPESAETPEFPAIKINQVTSIAQEDFPAIEIEGATSISEDAFQESPSEEGNEGEESREETVEITAMQTEEDKEQEPVNEVEENHQGVGGLIKRELEEGDDVPNRDNTDSDAEMDPEIAAALKASLLETQPMKEEIETSEKPLMNVMGSSSEDNDALINGDSIGRDEEEFTIEGVAEIGENPLDSECNPLEDPGDLDPFYEDGETIAVDEDTSGFLEKVNSGGFMTTIHSFPDVGGMGGRGPYKKKNQDEDYDPLDVTQPVKPKRKSRVRFQLRCNICQTAFQCIGDLKHHKFSNYDNQPKPNYLDLTEVLLSKYKKRGGITHKKILTELVADPLVEESAHKARAILVKALKFGVDVGRLRMGKPGKKNVSQRYYLAKVTERRQANMKFNRNKKLVEFVNTEPKPGPSKKSTHLQNISIPGISITRVASTKSPSSTSHPMLTPPDTRNYGRGLRQGIKRSMQVARSRPRQILPKPVTPSQISQATVTLDSDSDDDEIEVISEKITPRPARPKLKIVKVRSNALTTRPSLSSSSSSSHTVVKLGLSSKPRPSSEKFKTVKVSQQTAKKDPVEVSDPFAEDEDLTCRVCNSAFWFRSQIVEHLASKHNVQDPDTFLREKRTRL